jgi:hypothetical protein
MSSPQAYFSMLHGFFQRHNPLEACAMAIVQAIYNLITLRSRMKLLKYRYMLETRKLERIEKTLTSASVYDVVGQKMNRTY